MTTFVTNRPLLAYLLDRYIPLIAARRADRCAELRSIITSFAFSLPNPRSTWYQEEWLRVLLQHNLRAVGERYITALQPILMATFYSMPEVELANYVSTGQWELRALRIGV
jgi:hypothetical protein